MAIDPAPGTDARPDPGSASHTTSTTPVPRKGARPKGTKARTNTTTNTTPKVNTGAGLTSETVPASPPTPVAASAVATTDDSAPQSSRRSSKRIKARQVQRVVTRLDPWSMLKVSLLFALSMWLIVVVAGVLLWRVAVSTGTIGNFENFLATSLGEDTFTIDGSQIFQGSVVVGLVFFATGAVFAVVTSVLFNLIAGLVGGVRFTMVELETARPAVAETDRD